MITVQKGVQVEFNYNKIEFGMLLSELPEPTKKLETIYGYTDWLYANNYQEFYMVGVKDGWVINVFTTAKDYKTNGNDNYTISRMGLDGSRSMIKRHWKLTHCSLPLQTIILSSSYDIICPVIGCRTSMKDQNGT